MIGSVQIIFPLMKTKCIVLRPSYHEIDFTGLTIRINGVQLSQIGKYFDEHCKKTYLLQKRAMLIINRSSYNSHTDPLC